MFSLPVTVESTSREYETDIFVAAVRPAGGLRTSAESRHQEQSFLRCAGYGKRRSGNRTVASLDVGYFGKLQRVDDTRATHETLADTARSPLLAPLAFFGTFFRHTPDRRAIQHGRLPCEFSFLGQRLPPAEKQPLSRLGRRCGHRLRLCVDIGETLEHRRRNRARIRLYPLRRVRVCRLRKAHGKRQGAPLCGSHESGGEPYLSVLRIKRQQQKCCCRNILLFYRQGYFMPGKASKQARISGDEGRRAFSSTIFPSGSIKMKRGMPFTL